MPRQLTKERHNPLHVQMEQDSQAPLKNRSRAPKQQLQEGLIDSKGSRKILKMVKQQQQELSGLPTPTNHSDEDSDENADVEYNDWNAGESRLELDIAEQELMQKFMGKTREKVNISDLIMKQLQQDTGKQVEEGEKADIEQVQSVGELNPKVIEVYSKYNSIIQGGYIFITVQIRTAAKDIQDHSDSSRLGASLVHYQPRGMDPASTVPSNTDFHIKFESKNGTALFLVDPPRARS